MSTSKELTLKPLFAAKLNRPLPEPISKNFLINFDNSKILSKELRTGQMYFFQYFLQNLSVFPNENYS